MAVAESERLTTNVWGFAGTFTTSYGTKLGPEAGEGALSFEPRIVIPLDVTKSLELSTVVVRPADPYKNFALPRTYVAYSHLFYLRQGVDTKAILSANALDADLWKSDGYRLRTSAVLEISRAWITNVELSLRVGPFAQFNQYRQTTAGVSLPSYGLGERLKLAWSLGDFLVDIRLILNQSNAGSWKNDYATFEAVGYRLMPGVMVGLAHELLSSAIDDSTGLARPVRVFDGRDSRVSALLELEL